MRRFKPIHAAVRNAWFEVRFRYAYMGTVPEYDAATDTLVEREERREDESSVRVLAQNGAAASKWVKEHAPLGLYDTSGKAIGHQAIKDSVVILGVEQENPKIAPADPSVWQTRANAEGVLA